MKNLSCLLFISILTLFPSYFIASETDEDELTEPVQIINGQAVIFLALETQEISGLKTLQLKQQEYSPEYITYGKVIDLSALQTIHHQYFSASILKADAITRLNQSQKNLTRLRNLHQNQAISSRKLQAQLRQLQTDKTAVNIATNQIQTIINQSKLQWGEILTQWATNSSSADFESLIKGTKKLLKTTLPAGKILTKNLATIHISTLGERSLAFKASLLSLHSVVDSFSQGLQYFFLTENNTVKPGMRFTAWIEQKNNKQSGFIIPDSAVVRHLGQTMFYTKIDHQHFLHQDINKAQKVKRGYFIESLTKQNIEIVVNGVQMLLSHEFRSQIPDEDDDD